MIDVNRGFGIFSSDIPAGNGVLCGAVDGSASATAGESRRAMNFLGDHGTEQRQKPPAQSSSAAATGFRNQLDQIAGAGGAMTEIHAGAGTNAAQPELAVHDTGSSRTSTSAAQRLTGAGTQIRATNPR